MRRSVDNEAVRGRQLRAWERGRFRVSDVTWPIEVLLTTLSSMIFTKLANTTDATVNTNKCLNNKKTSCVDDLPPEIYRRGWRQLLRHHQDDCVSCAELRRRCRLDKLLSSLLQRLPSWFGDAARHEQGELMPDRLVEMPSPLICSFYGNTAVVML